jgi:outer membrane protein OmpA-like peptidoglycan-associated protein
MLRAVFTIAGILLLATACGQNTQTASLTKPAPAAPMEARTWMVFFDTNSVKLSEQANNTVSAAAASAKATPTARVRIAGYTDTEGGMAYNQALSVRRANAVRDALVAQGVAPGAVAIVGEGELGQLVPTGDQVRYPSNRRVAVVVQ